jgi:hypothetical protein
MLTVGLFFGIFHLDIYRLIPTAPWYRFAPRRHRSGPHPVHGAHAVFNGAALGVGLGRRMRFEAWISSPLLLAPAAAALVLSVKGLAPVDRDNVRVMVRA